MMSKMNAGEKQTNRLALKIKQLSSEFKLHCFCMIADKNGTVFLREQSDTLPDSLC